ncbi:hypothetical protein TNCV_3002541 [Trichonephila clavipes]|nr:hypothetical protein TNCV_3002541 [Trichonephila clavipes]
MCPLRTAPLTFWVMGSLVVRASNSRPEGLGSMPDATKNPLTFGGGGVLLSIHGNQMASKTTKTAFAFILFKCLVCSLTIVVEITQLQLRSGMKSFVTGWEVSLRLAIASVSVTVRLLEG